MKIYDLLEKSGWMSILDFLRGKAIGMSNKSEFAHFGREFYRVVSKYSEYAHIMGLDIEDRSRVWRKVREE